MRKFKKVCEECCHCDTSIGREYSNIWKCTYSERKFNYCSTERAGYGSGACGKAAKNWKPLNETIREKYLDRLPFYRKIDIKEVIKGWLLT